MTTTMTNDKAVSAFLVKKFEIDEMLARLVELSTNHFGVSSDDINWGHVGDLGRYAELLKQVTDLAFNEGEHAK